MSDEMDALLRQAVEATAEAIRRGRPFGLLLAGGGPTIWLLADGPFRPYLEGTWFGCEDVRIDDGSDKAFETYMDYFIDRDGDE